MNKQKKWIELFEQVIGRKPSPQEFLLGKESDFDFKQIKSIAEPLVEGSVNNSHIAESSHTTEVSPLVEKQVIQQVRPAKIKSPLTKSQKIKRGLVLAGVLLLASLGAGYYYGQSITGTDVAAEEFTDAVASNDYDQVAKLLTTKDEKWSKSEAKTFINYLKSNQVDIESQLDAIAESKGKTVYNDENGNKLLGMQKTGDLLGIFPTYQVISYPLEVKVKTNLSDVTVDGKKIEKDKTISLGQTKFTESTYQVTGKTDLGNLTTNASVDLSKAENNEVLLSLASNLYKIDASLPSDVTDTSNIKLIVNGKEVATSLTKELQLLDNQEIDVHASFDYEGSTYTTEKTTTFVNPDQKTTSVSLKLSSDASKRIEEAKKAKSEKEAQAKAEKEAQAQADKEAQARKSDIQSFMNSYISSMRDSVSSRTVQFSSYFDTNSTVYATYVNFIENQVRSLQIDYQTTLDYTVTDVKAEDSGYAVTVHNKYREVYMNGKSDIVEKNQVFHIRPSGMFYNIYEVSEY